MSDPAFSNGSAMWRPPSDAAAGYGSPACSCAASKHAPKKGALAASSPVAHNLHTFPSLHCTSPISFNRAKIVAAAR